MLPVADVPPSWIAVIANAVPVVAVLRIISDRTIGKRSPASGHDLRTIRALFAQEDGQIVRATRDRTADMLTPADREHGPERTYNVTLQVGTVRLRRRVVCQDGAPAYLLPP